MVEHKILAFSELGVKSFRSDERVHRRRLRARAVDDDLRAENAFLRPDDEHSVLFLQRGHPRFGHDFGAVHHSPVRQRDRHLVGRHHSPVRGVKHRNDAVRKRRLYLQSAPARKYLRSDAVEVGAAFKLPQSFLSAGGRSHHRTAFERGHAEFVRQRPRHGVAAHVETRLQRPRLAVVTRVHDAAVGARGSDRNVVAGLQKAYGNIAARQSVKHGAADYSSAYHYNVFCHNPPLTCRKRHMNFHFTNFFLYILMLSRMISSAKARSFTWNTVVSLPSSCLYTRKKCEISSMMWGGSSSTSL